MDYEYGNDGSSDYGSQPSQGGLMPEILPDPVEEVSPTKSKASNRKPLNFSHPLGQPVVVKYKECLKQGLHQNQLLNLVCLDKDCIENSLICGVCMEQEHKSHNVRPLKLVMEHARRKRENLSSLKDTLPILQTFISQHQRQLIRKHDELETTINPIFDTTQKLTIAANSKILQELSTQEGQEEIIEKINSLEHQEMDAESFVKLVINLHQGIPAEDPSSSTPQTQEEHLSYIQTSNATVEHQLKLITTNTLSTIKGYSDFISTLQVKTLMQKEVNYQFDNSLKHSTISITENSAKSTTGSDYHFALLNPSLAENKNKVQKVAFKIVKNTSNWVAVGMCHQKTVEVNGYNFAYSSIEHGGYLISSNGGSWSALAPQNNNSVKAFKFVSGDTIFLSIDFTAKTLTFQKKKTSKNGKNQTYVLEFEQRSEDPLHLCVLFYYQNDHVQYLGKAEENQGVEDLPEYDPYEQDEEYNTYDDDYQ